MKNLNYSRHLFGHKYLEIEAVKQEGVDHYVTWRLTSKGDHAGLMFHFQIGRMYVGFNVTDNRHWNWDRDAWCVYDDDDKHG